MSFKPFHLAALLVLFAACLSLLHSPSSPIQSSGPESFPVPAERRGGLGFRSLFRASTQSAASPADSYVTNAGQLDRDARVALEGQAWDMATAKLTSDCGLDLWEEITGEWDWSPHAHRAEAGELEVSKAYLLTLKPGFEEEARNFYTVICSVPLTITEGDVVKYSGAACFTVRFPNLSEGPDGPVAVDLSTGSQMEAADGWEDAYARYIAPLRDRYAVEELAPVDPHPQDPVP